MAGKKEKTKENVKNQFLVIRKAGVPLCGIETADPEATIVGIEKALGDKYSRTPVLEWDLALSLRKGRNKAGMAVFSELAPDGVAMLSNPVECLSELYRKVEASPVDSVWKDMVFFVHNAHRLMDGQGVSQAIWNLRDTFKSMGCTLVLLGPTIVLPSELKHDVVVISEPLPGEEELLAITEEMLEATEKAVKKEGKVFPTVSIESKKKAADILRGLSAFAAEQVVAMSCGIDGINEDMLWQRKKRMIEQTPGLQVWKGGETFEMLGGLENLKSFLTGLLKGLASPIRAILYIDEVEKSLAGAAGDLSGTSQDQLGVMLRVMQDNDLPGIILVGAPGTGKSAIAKASGNIVDIPVIACDLGAMKGSLVGESEAKIRAAMDVFLAICAGKGIVLATANKLQALPPELKRRFSLGTFYVDLPGPKEQKKIWDIWLKRYEISGQTIPECAGWTGAEIRACCDISFRTAMSLVEAAKFIVPVAKSSPESITQLRTMSNGKFIDAHREGMYDMMRTEEVEKSGRKISVS
jgi:hypothetical protein